MKTTSLLTLTATWLAFSAVAGSDVIIRERAKGMRDANNASQGVMPPAAAAPSAPAAPAPSPGVAKVKADLAALKLGDTVSAEQKQQLAQHLVAVAQGTTKTSCAAATKLAEELSAALTEHSFPAAGRARLAQELDALLNPGKYPQARPEGIYKDIQTSFQGAGLSQSKALAIVETIKALATEVR